MKVRISEIPTRCPLRSSGIAVSWKADHASHELLCWASAICHVRHSAFHSFKIMHSRSQCKKPCWARPVLNDSTHLVAAKASYRRIFVAFMKANTKMSSQEWVVIVSAKVPGSTAEGRDETNLKAHSSLKLITLLGG